MTNEKGLFLSLDEIFDTRMGLIGLINPEVASQLLLTNQYYDRKGDIEFIEKLGLTRLQWDQRYAQRDNMVLANSFMTRCIHFIQFYQSEMKAQYKLERHSAIFNVTINTYPYQLEPEFLEVLKEELFEKIPLSLKIEFVHWDMRKKDMHALNHEFRLVIMYDYGNWMKIHKEKLLGIGVPLLEIIVPRLLHEDFFKHLDDDIMARLIKEDEVDPFEIIEGASSLFWQITYHGLEIFNIALPRSTNTTFQTAD